MPVELGRERRVDPSLRLLWRHDEIELLAKLRLEEPERWEDKSRRAKRFHVVAACQRAATVRAQAAVEPLEAGLQRHGEEKAALRRALLHALLACEVEDLVLRTGARREESDFAARK